MHSVHIAIDSFEATPSPESSHGIETILGIDADDAPGDTVAFPDSQGQWQQAHQQHVAA